MRRSHLGILSCILALWGCDTSPTDPHSGPDGQIIPTSCDPSNTVSLNRGEAADFEDGFARFFCLNVAETGAGSPAAYTLILSSNANDPVSLQLRLGQLEPLVLAAPSEAGVAGPTNVGSRSDAMDLGDDFHRALRERELRELSDLVGSGSPLSARAPQAPAAVPSVGEILTLNTQTNIANSPNGACQVPVNVSARVEVVSARAIVAVDIQNPPGGFIAADLHQYAAHFDTLLAPLAEETFGEMTDIDGNGGRTILLFTKEVNRLTPTNTGSFTVGFFFARDLFPKQGDGRFQGCPQSNEAEILYLLVPDPNGVYGPRHLRSAIDPIMRATIIHELQHLINAGRRMYINANTSSNWTEEVWLNEGLSHIAEELLFFRAARLGPLRNISASLLASQLGFAASVFDRHQRLNFLRFFDYIADPGNHSPYGSVASLETRGAAWHFLRYAADRLGPEQGPVFHALANSPNRGFANLGSVLGGTDVLFDRLADWRVAIYSDPLFDAASQVAERHRDLSWNLRSIQPMVREGPYPLRTEAASIGTTKSYPLAAGGSVYLLLSVVPGTTGTFAITRSGIFPPDAVRATILRTN